ncbi:MAG TPA: endonuclease/exonuclease/phosphatase family protein [Patescibacteria group bacterium]|nr:endonuclease/exonuclease/phosphatase family protein [Patescibacteria group bacterium]
MFKLISINIEDEKHIDRVLDFIHREKPDVLCLQELLERDVPIFEKALDARSIFAPMGVLPPADSQEIIGVGIFSLFPLHDVRSHYYAQYSDHPRIWHDEITDPTNRVLLSAKITVDGIPYTVATTHFTWTPGGEASPRQRRDLSALLTILSEYDEILFCGDMNAPRGKETFDAIAERYQDHIPPQYLTSLDPEFHRTKGEEHLMVDGLFSTPHYEVEGVRLQSGISDHMVIVATIGTSASIGPALTFRHIEAPLTPQRHETYH